MSLPRWVEECPKEVRVLVKEYVQCAKNQTSSSADGYTIGWHERCLNLQKKLREWGVSERNIERLYSKYVMPCL